MKGGGIGKAKAGASSGSVQWIPEPDAVNIEDYDFSHYYDVFSGNISYDEWFVLHHFIMKLLISHGFLYRSTCIFVT